MLKIAIISIVTIFLSGIIKNKNSEISTVISVCGGFLILIQVYNMLQEIINYFLNIGDSLNISNSILKLSVKIVGVGYLTEFVSDIANDMGNSAISSKVVLGGKIVICYLTLPVLKELLSLLLSFY